MEPPPRIAEGSAREIPIEVLPPEGRPGSEPSGGLHQGGDRAPIHALSALTLVAVDSLWVVFDLAPVTWPAAIPLCFLAVFLPVFLVQRHLKRDTPGQALAYATLLATLAAIPTPVTGTPVGLGLLAWSGLGRFFGRALPKQ